MLHPDEGGVVHVPLDVTVIDSDTIAGGFTVRHVVLHSGVRNIKQHAFHGCAASLQTVDFGSAALSIGKSAFSRCSVLNAVWGMENVHTIEAWAFYDCLALTSVLCAAARIGARAFDGCTALLKFVSSVPWKPESHAFAKCIKLTEIAGFTSIPSGLFSFCNALTRVDSDGLIDEVGGLAFSMCRSLKRIRLQGTRIIRSRAFMGCTTLGTVDLPHALEFHAGAFGQCTKLSTLKAPVLRVIEPNVFDMCRGLTVVNLDNVVEVGDCAFKNCTHLMDVSFKSATQLGASVFCGCVQLQTVSLPLVQKLERETFLMCTSLTHVNIRSATDIGIRCFARCTSLRNFPSMPNLAIIRTKAFEQTGLVKVVTGAAHVMDYVFSGTTALKVIIFLPGVQLIGSCCVRFAPVEHIVFPDTVQTVGDFAFTNCKAIKSITMAEHTPRYGKRVLHVNAFRRCTAVTISGPPVLFRRLGMQHVATPKAQLAAYVWSRVLHRKTPVGPRVRAVVFTMYNIFQRLQLPPEMCMCVLAMMLLSDFSRP